MKYSIKLNQQTRLDPLNFTELERSASMANVKYDKSLITKNSSVLVNDDMVHISCGTKSQVQCSANGSITTMAINDVTKAVRKTLDVDEVMINNHKLNNQFIDYSDFCEVNKKPIGDLMTQSTIITKTWDHSLKKNVLIRRQAYIPLFGKTVNVPDTPEAFSIDGDIRKELEAILFQSKVGDE